PSLLNLLAENANGLHVLIDDLDWGALECSRSRETSAEVSRLRLPHSALHEAFGDRLWLEVVRPPRSAARERALLEAGRRLGLQPVASVAAHFATPEGYPTFRLLTAVRQGILLDQVPARLPITPAHHLPEIERVYQRFRDLPEAIVNAEHLAEQCRSDVLPRGLVLPAPRVPHAHDAFSYLRLLCERGLRRRKVSGEWLVVSGKESAPGVARPERREGRAEASVVSTPVEDSGRATRLTTHHSPLTAHSAARQRLDEELHIIRQRGLAGYFLIVRQIAREARRRRFSMALRGSAGNSLICYLLGITDVDPLRFDLPLERFLHA